MGRHVGGLLSGMIIILAYTAVQVVSMAGPRETIDAAQWLSTRSFWSTLRNDTLVHSYRGPTFATLAGSPPFSHGLSRSPFMPTLDVQRHGPLSGYVCRSA
jgi:hypothetical protein